jgi:putative endonuclease
MARKKLMMKRELRPCGYIMPNKGNRVLYTGVTSNLFKRVAEHKNKVMAGFTSNYNLTKLVYYEALNTMEEAIARENQIKGGSRQKKVDLINSKNPEWKDLYEEFFASFTVIRHCEGSTRSGLPEAISYMIVELAHLHGASVVVLLPHPSSQ